MNNNTITITTTTTGLDKNVLFLFSYFESVYFFLRLTVFARDGYTTFGFRGVTAGC